MPNLNNLMFYLNENLKKNKFLNYSKSEIKKIQKFIISFLNKNRKSIKLLNTSNFNMYLLSTMFCLF